MREVFYNSERTLYQIFSEFKLIDKNGKEILTQIKFDEIVKKYTKLTIKETSEIFSMISKGSDSVFFQDFRNFFEITNPLDTVKF